MRATLAVLLTVGLFGASCSDGSTSEMLQRTTTQNQPTSIEPARTQPEPEPTTTGHDQAEPAGTAPEFVDGPSQSEQAARRDGVVAELAALGFTERVSEQLRVEDGGQTWITSRIPAATRQASYVDGCGLGHLGGQYPTEVICTDEYGEVLLLDADGQIDRAFPMPGAPPDWIELTAEAAYAGRIGDGGLPWSSLATIDRASFAVDVIVFPTGLVDPSEGNTWPPDWRFGTVDQLPTLEEMLLGIGDGAFDPAKAERLRAGS